MIIAGAEQLFVTENAVDQALTEAGELIATLTRFRVGGGFSGMLGHKAVDSIVKATTSLGDARRHITDAHTHLDEVKTHMGGAAVAVGTGQDKPMPDHDVPVHPGAQSTTEVTRA
ncbi:hypothetical protein [Asticcacaulis sp.]|jgi:hypothetical protein|uniref:hypothetical protein n=1 Tax=Asticcacaulis sp. TaxID=1872648 RepID=UPI003F7C36F3